MSAAVPPIPRMSWGLEGGKFILFTVYFFLHRTVKTRRWNSCIAPLILNFGSGWWWLFSFTPRPLYPRKRIPVPIGMGLLGSQSRSGRTEEDKNLLILPGFRLRYPGSIIVIITTNIYLLCEWCLQLYTWNTPWYLCNVIAILHLQFVVFVMLFPMLNALHFTSALSAVCVS
jgi:hypothetical protein